VEVVELAAFCEGEDEAGSAWRAASCRRWRCAVEMDLLRGPVCGRMWRDGRASAAAPEVEAEAEVDEGCSCVSTWAAESASVVDEVAVDNCGRLLGAEGESWTEYFERIVDTLPCVANGGRPASAAPAKSGFTCASDTVVAMDSGLCVFRSSILPDCLLLSASVGDVVEECDRRREVRWEPASGRPRSTLGISTFLSNTLLSSNVAAV